MFLMEIWQLSQLLKLTHKLFLQKNFEEMYKYLSNQNTVKESEIFL